MPELGFLLSKREERVIIEAAFELGCCLIPDLRYDERVFTVSSSYQTYEVARERTRLFFLTSQAYSKAPLEFQEIRSTSGQKFFSICQRTGGPAIEFMSSVEFLDSGVHKINPGFLSHYPTFWDQEQNQNVKAPDELRTVYRGLSSVIKRLARQKKLGARTYAVGNEVADLLDRKEIAIGINGVAWG